MKTMTESATKPEQDKTDEVKTDKKRNVCDVTNIAGDEERKRLAGFERMSNRLFRRYDEELLPLQKRYRASEDEYRYRVGVIVVDIQDNHLAYGRSDIKQLADALECSSSNLYDYARVSRAWEYEEFSELMNREGRQGYRLRFSHLIEIAGMSDPKERRWWIDEVLKEGWTVKELCLQIKPPPVITEATETTEDDSDENAVSELDATHPTPTRICQTIVRLDVEVESIPMWIAEWNAFVHEPLVRDPDLSGDDVIDKLRESSEKHAVAIKAFQENKKLIDDEINLKSQPEKLSGASQTKEGGGQDV